MRRTPIVLATLISSFFLLTAASCSSSTDGVSTEAVRRADVTEVVDVPATVTVRASATLTAPADGTLSKLTVQPGATVRKGAVLAVVDSPSARKRLADASAALASARGFRGSSVDLSGLQSSLDAAAGDAFTAARTAADKVADPTVRAALLAQVTAAQKHYTSAANASRQALTQVQQGLAGIGDAVAALGAAQRAQAQAAYDVAKAGVDALTLRAPISGVVQLARPTTGGASDPLAALISGAGGGSAASALAGGGAGAGASSADNQPVAGVDDVLAVGDAVSAGAPVVTVVDLSDIGLAGNVDETDVLLVQPGITADVELDAAPGQTYTATVRTIDLLPTTSARGGVAYRVRLAFAAVDRTVANDSPAPPTPRPGMSAVAHLRVRTAAGALSVPASAVITGDHGDTVWLVGSDGKAIRQPVTLGIQGENLVQVVSGLQPGQRVVSAGADKVTAGQDLP